MSFLDEVQTTVANSQFLLALNTDQQPVKLTLTPYEELQEFDASVRQVFTIDQLFVLPLAGYQFNRYLRRIGLNQTATFLADIDDYRSTFYTARREKGLTIHRRHLVEGGDWRGGGDEGGGAHANADSDGGVAAGAAAAGGKPFSANSIVPINEDDDGDGGKKGEGGGSNAAGNGVAANGGNGTTIADGSDDKYMPMLRQNEQEEITLVLVELQREPSNPRHQGCARKKLFSPLRNRLKALLADEFPKFLDSPEYQRFVSIHHYARQPVSAEDFLIFRALGRGAFGMVSAVQKTDTFSVFAMKQMSKAQVKAQKSVNMCISERKVLSRMHSPFVVHLLYAFHDPVNLYLIMDMCSGGDLKFHLRSEKDGRFPLDRATFYAAEVLLGLKHIHSFDIVYRDLKPHNVLLDMQGHVKLSDLGLAVRLRENSIIRQVAGTAGYWAPEIIGKKGTYKASDIWSFGVFVYEMLVGCRPKCRCSQTDDAASSGKSTGKSSGDWCPFGMNRKMEAGAQLADAGPPRLDGIDWKAKGLSPQAIDLLRNIFIHDINMRLGGIDADERVIQSHPFFSSSIDWGALRHVDMVPPWVPSHRDVHAASIAEVGAINTDKYRDITLTPEDQDQYQGWTFSNELATQKELRDALYRMDHAAANDSGKEKNKGDGGCGCCSIM